jgi:hypothetical protein
MSEQVESIPAERVGDLEHITDILPEVVAGIGRTLTASAMTGGVERNEMTAGEQRRQKIEAARVIEPAVQRYYASAAGIAPFERREPVSRQLKLAFDRRPQRGTGSDYCPGESWPGDRPSRR